jgi:hypothetical protein
MPPPPPIRDAYLNEHQNKPSFTPTWLRPVAPNCVPSISVLHSHFNNFYSVTGMDLFRGLCGARKSHSSAGRKTDNTSKWRHNVIVPRLNDWMRQVRILSGMQQVLHRLRPHESTKCIRCNVRCDVRCSNINKLTYPNIPDARTCWRTSQRTK